jgi:hypothetical protein
MNPGYPFEHCGVDWAGPFVFKASDLLYEKKKKQIWIAIFTCMTTKATHVEICHDKSLIAFVAAFERFCSRRNTPSHMYSDNGKNFVGTDNGWKNLNEQCREVANEKRIRWHFNPAGAPRRS